MSSCLASCTAAECLAMPSCTAGTTLTLGTATGAGTYRVYLENIATGYVSSVQITVDNTLVVAVDPTTLQRVNPANVYRMWMTLAADSLYDTQPILVDGNSYDCFLLNFTRTNNTPNNQTLTPLT